ncbi:MAG: acetyl esterase [Cryptosporangiaceae bacterium]|nr:acetyl esterase [Cryptosporangiaceae bacterium]
MTLHPQSRTALAAAGAPIDPTYEWLVGHRANLDATSPANSGPPIALPVVADVDAGGVPARLYDPRYGRGAPVLVYVHGGGWCAGSLETVDGLCRRIAHRSGVAVLSIGYRLAPEHQWPAGLDDVETAIAWLRASAETHGIDATRLAIAGDSSGGNLAAVVARRARDRGEPFAFQALVYPATDAVDGTPAGDPDEGTGLTNGRMAHYWNWYLPEGADRKDPDVSPAHAESLEGLPPALVITAEYDVLREEGERYAVAMAEAGVPVVLARYQGLVHGFARELANFDGARAAADQIAGAVREALDPPR